MENSMKQICLLLGAIAFVVMGTSAATAQGNGAVTEKFDVETYIDNPCCGGTIDLTGTIHVAYNPKNETSHVNYSNLTGSDGDGNVFHAAAVGNSHSEYNEDDGSYSVQVNQTIRFSSSSGCSFTIRWLGSYGWNPVDGYWEDFKINEITCEDDLS
jgi:hypothetical protein